MFHMLCLCRCVQAWWYRTPWRGITKHSSRWTVQRQSLSSSVLEGSPPLPTLLLLPWWRCHGDEGDTGLWAWKLASQFCQPSEAVCIILLSLRALSDLPSLNFMCVWVCECVCVHVCVCKKEYSKEKERVQQREREREYNKKQKQPTNVENRERTQQKAKRPTNLDNVGVGGGVGVGGFDSLGIWWCFPACLSVVKFIVDTVFIFLMNWSKVNLLLFTMSNEGWITF